MFESVLKMFGSDETNLKKYKSTIDSINGFEEQFSKFSDSQLKEKTRELKENISHGETMENILPGAFAIVREAAKRVLSQRHYDVQLVGGVILHQGKIAEMKTGEGKTLVATLPAYLNALAGKGVHIVTVNDYLSRRDAVWMGQIYDMLGLNVGCINHESSYLYDPEHINPLDKTRDELGSFKVVHEFLKPCTRREAYEADITYGTNNEFGFDYLRDNLAYDKSQMVQREHYYAIVDEIDSILIDEARTPLIISAPAEESSDFYISFSRIAEKLEKEKDYTVDEKFRAASLTEDGIEKAEKLLGVKDIYTEKGIKYVHHLETAVRAKALFHRDKDYVIKDNEIIIVDEFTGRLMPGRRWADGLHQAVEAREGVHIQKESRTVASITFQNYFKMYEKLSGMTGTALTSAEEFYKVYKLETVSVPTNKPLVRKDLPDLIFQTERGKFTAIIKKIRELNQKGQPVLVGTASIERNEYFSALLKKEGIQYQILNAKNHEEEGQIIAQAGEKGKVTIATNMAGRGVDIVLGGNPPNLEDVQAVRESGGLFVLGTERHEARRIDNQLRGRSGRQGDPGETQFFVSLEDELMRVFGPERIKNMMGRFGIPEDQPIENKMITRAIESAQGKIEGFNFDARQHVLEYDDVLNHQRNIIYKRRKNILWSDNNFIKESLENLFLNAHGFYPEEEINKFKIEAEKRREEFGDEKFYQGIRVLMLQATDMHWMQHLEVLDYLRSSVRLRAYGQRDPLVEYKNEAIRMFRELENSINNTIINMAGRMGIVNPSKSNPPSLKVSADAQFRKSPTASRIGKIGRNDPCPCGSGTKYKKCCGR